MLKDPHHASNIDLNDDTSKKYTGPLGLFNLSGYNAVSKHGR